MPTFEEMDARWKGTQPVTTDPTRTWGTYTAPTTTTTTTQPQTLADLNYGSSVVQDWGAPTTSTPLRPGSMGVMGPEFYGIPTREAYGPTPDFYAGQSPATFGYNPNLFNVDSSGLIKGTTPTPTSPTPGQVQTAGVGQTGGTGVPQPQNYIPAQPPQFAANLSDLYKSTFANPQQFWQEYSQGQGSKFAEAGARAMAKAGRTGMLPTLQSQMYRDYMSEYVPSVRKDLQAGLSYEQAMNQTLSQLYGQQLDYNRGMYTADVSRYGHELGLEQAKLQAASSARDSDVRLQLGQLDAQLKELGINEETYRHLYTVMGNSFQFMSAEDQKSLITEIQSALGIENATSQLSAYTSAPDYQSYLDWKANQVAAANA